jgi:hypothetical protein
LEVVFAELQQVWRELKPTSRFGQLHLSMFTNPKSPLADFPRLKGRAAEIRGMGPALHRVWSQHMIPDNIQHKQIQLLLKLGCKMEDMLDEHRELACFPEDIAGPFENFAWGYVRLFSALAAYYNGLGQFQFNVTIKSHMIVHAAQGSRNLNPRKGWCYGGEDFMHKARVLIASCLKGTPVWKYGKKFVKKYSAGLAMRMSEKRFWAPN